MDDYLRPQLAYRAADETLIRPIDNERYDAKVSANTSCDVDGRARELRKAIDVTRQQRNVEDAGGLTCERVQNFCRK